MAPLTRCQATEDGHVPRTESMLKYYEDRASAGLIIAEATMVQPNYTGFLTEPGIYSMRRLRSGERSWMRYTKRVALYPATHSRWSSRDSGEDPSAAEE
ncbi:hypothetical protein TcBrA4_0070070 [Trypanosoma cruzi]|nr:hypothetical protein TcBrA4_0070070 [Trypanosoma cruzi]